MKKKMIKITGWIAMTCILSFAPGCSEQITDTWVKVIKVSDSDGKDSHWYVHRDVHTLVETNGRRFIVPGDLGEPGDEIALRYIPPTSLYY